jgi:esterase/lipase
MKTEPIELTVDGSKLKGNIYFAAEPRGLALLFLHGWTGITNEDAAGILAQNGFSAMTFSLSGHGDSQGKIEDQTREKSFKEVLAAYDLFKSKLPEGTKIGVAGNSYGAYMASMLTVERPVACLQLRVPANYRDELFKELQVNQGAGNPEVVKWRELKLDYQSTRALGAIHEFKGPIQLIEAEHDERVSHQAVQNYVDAVSDKKQLEYHFMKGWTHSLGLDSERNRQYQEMLLKWLGQQV